MNPPTFSVNLLELRVDRVAEQIVSIERLRRLRRSVRLLVQDRRGSEEIRDSTRAPNERNPNPSSHLREAHRGPCGIRRDTRRTPRRHPWRRHRAKPRQGSMQGTLHTQPTPHPVVRDPEVLRQHGATPRGPVDRAATPSPPVRFHSNSPKTWSYGIAESPARMDTCSKSTSIQRRISL